MSTYQQIPLDQVDPSPFQTRRFAHGAEDLQELAASIRELGVLEPVLVRPAGDRFELLAGERRTRAARLVDLETIPAIIREVDDDVALEVCITENLQRQDLHPLDEADAVALMLHRYAGDAAEVAARLGRSESFVARRSRLSSLAERWRRAIAREPGTCVVCGCTEDAACAGGCSWANNEMTRCSECSEDAELDLSGWGVTHLEAIARIAPEDQERLLDEMMQNEWHELRTDRWGEVPTAAEVAEIIDSSMRRLSAAPWGFKDAELVPEAGACSACPHRSFANPGLFDQDADARKDDRCLSPACWDRKAAAHLAATRQHLEAETGETPLELSTRHSGRPKGAEYLHNYRRSDEPKRGYKPAIVVDGHEAGMTIYVAPQRTGTTGDTENAPKTMKEKREGLRRRRYKLAIEKAQEALSASDECPGRDELLVIVAAIGTDMRYDYGDHAWWKNRAEHSDLPGSLTGLLEALEEPRDADLVGELLPLLWKRMLVPIILRRTNYHSGLDIDAAWAQLGAVCRLVDIDVDPLLEQATEEIPEPKSWAKEAA